MAELPEGKDKSKMKTINVGLSVSHENDKKAEQLRSRMRGEGVLMINLMSSPGAGKSTLLKRTVRDLKGQLQIAVMEADIASTVDAEAMAAAGAKAIQLHTDGMCHMDAGMTEAALDAFDYSGSDIIFLENVGNLICPAEFDTGAEKKVMILSIPEGDDKPLKYPLMFRESDVLLITKLDTLPFFNFDMKACLERVKALNPDIAIFPLSAKNGEGMADWEDWLSETLTLLRREE